MQMWPEWMQGMLAGELAIMPARQTSNYVIELSLHLYNCEHIITVHSKK